MGHKAIASFVI